jgi:hypothetical protein
MHARPTIVSRAFFVAPAKLNEFMAKAVSGSGRRHEPRDVKQA